MRAVAYNDAVQTFVLILGSACLTFYGLHKLGGWHELRYWCGSEMFNLWKPMIPPGVQGTWAPVLQTDAAGKVVKEAWYFNGYFPWVGIVERLWSLIENVRARRPPPSTSSGAKCAARDIVQSFRARRRCPRTPADGSLTHRRHAAVRSGHRRLRVERAALALPTTR